MPSVESFIQKCETAEDMMLISNCLIALDSLVDDSLAEMFYQQVRKLLNSNVISSETSSGALIRILRASVVTSLYVTKECSDTIRHLLYVVEHSPLLAVSYPDIPIYWVKRAYERIREPYGVAKRMENLACSWLENVNIDLNHLTMLSCITRYGSADRRKRIEQCLLEILNHMQEPELFKYYLKTVYHIIRQLNMLILLFYKTG